MTDRTKKRKDNSNSVDKAKLWNIFDSEINNKASNGEPLEYICGSISNREVCEHCTSTLFITEDGFLTCTNFDVGTPNIVVAIFFLSLKYTLRFSK